MVKRHQRKSVSKIINNIKKKIKMTYVEIKERIAHQSSAGIKIAKRQRRNIGAG